MYLIGKKPVIVLGTTAMIALGASGITAQARESAATSGAAQAQRGQGRGLDTAALAKSLGVSETELTTALAAVRSELGTGGRSADLAVEAKAIADSLDVEPSVITTVLKAQAAKNRPTQDTRPTSPQAEEARPTTPPKGMRDGRRGPGGPRGGTPDRAALITAIAKATGKTENAVKAALHDGRTAHQQAAAARAAEFAKLLASKLGLEASTVSTAITNLQPVRPSQAAKTPAGATS